jgi:DNA repair protein RadA/Sms
LKKETLFVCQSCGHKSGKWLGKCPECGEWNSLVEEKSQPIRKGNRNGFQLRDITAVAFTEIEPQDDVRVPSGVTEFDRVLGGGIVPGTLVLIGGDPGIGKSTLLLQVADKLSAAGSLVLYVSGEESERQIKLRGERLAVEAKNVFLLPETNLENIINEIERLKPGAIIVDSIQTVFSSAIESAPGSVSQVREVAHQFLLLAKNRGTPIFLIGHITKEGSIAGPKILEHIVDTVLYFEGERHHNHRIVRAVKNRFGAANEVGVFEMTGAGLMPVANPSQMFLQERPQNVAGSIVTACMEGTRPLLVEIQALVSGSKYGAGRRMTQGLDQNRVALLIAMLEKRASLQLTSDDVFVNIAGGLEVDGDCFEFQECKRRSAHRCVWRGRVDWRSAWGDAGFCTRA